MITVDLEIVRRVLVAPRTERQKATLALAEKFEEAGNQLMADVLRMPPGPVTLPSIVLLAEPLPPEMVGELCGKMLARVLCPLRGEEVVREMMERLSADQRGDLREWVEVVLDEGINYRAEG